ncbi:MAG: biotin-dependent carboxyltransferase family protein [Synergistaceae bacterium]|jgi:biotin-dependent carboxylase-like uncharacterized protein|nr:biotin-dependent carboxyltransferase family protein [Synergistaceae bacterium]
MKLLIEKPGMFTAVQDLGRRGFQMLGVPVAGAMDALALRLGNVLVGNEKDVHGLEPAGLEITVMGPSIRVTEGEGCFAVTGAEAGVTKNGVSLPCWTAHGIAAGDVVAFFPPKTGSRAYFCVSGGIDVPVVMGSRSTYSRGGFGGYRGRALKSGDVLLTGTPEPFQSACEGLTCPPHLRPPRDAASPLRVIAGPQDDYFTPEGLETFYASEYVITNSADRMGYRMEGPTIAHRRGADIISDAISMGSIQIPGHGQPIAMLADRQTTGGYTKIATICGADVARLAQRLPGQKVRFEKITVEEAVTLLRRDEELVSELRRLRASWRLKTNFAGPLRGTLKVCVDGEPHDVEWERLDRI